MTELDGEWEVVPLPGVRKRIRGDRGWTSIGRLPGAPFDVRGLELHYRFPFRGLVDVLEPDGEGYRGRAKIFGRDVGGFRLRRAR
ncbi:MAG: hypothetical protein ICV67_05125 [Thermoleophilia bacterium]|nr:hypothetical protein [Thermoleophilia bacterium]